VTTPVMTTQVMTTSVEANLLDKYQQAQKKITSLRGPFSLFGLFERRDTPGRLDLVVSAPWLSTDRNGMQDLAQHLPYLTDAEGALMGRIVGLDPDDEFVRTLNQAVQTTGQLQETDGLQAWKVDVAHSFIFASQRLTGHG
jgi:hypothetical protein